MNGILSCLRHRAWWVFKGSKQTLLFSFLGCQDTSIFIGTTLDTWPPASLVLESLFLRFSAGHEASTWAWLLILGDQEQKKADNLRHVLTFLRGIGFRPTRTARCVDGSGSPPSSPSEKADRSWARDDGCVARVRETSRAL